MNLHQFKHCTSVGLLVSIEHSQRKLLENEHRMLNSMKGIAAIKTKWNEVHQNGVQKVKLKRDVNVKYRMEKTKKMVLYVANRQDCNIESLGQWRLQELKFAKVIDCLNSPLKWTSGNMLKKSCMATSGELGQPLVI
jgi:ribosome biogenesis protein Tsr3